MDLTNEVYAVVRDVFADSTDPISIVLSLHATNAGAVQALKNVLELYGGNGVFYVTKMKVYDP